MTILGELRCWVNVRLKLPRQQLLKAETVELNAVAEPEHVGIAEGQDEEVQVDGNRSVNVGDGYSR